MILREYEEDIQLSRELFVGDREVLQDLHRQWCQCIVQLHGAQYSVYKVRAYRGQIVAVLILPLGSSPSVVVSLDHPDLLKTYPEVGYSNIATSAVYVTRRVARQWKKGVHENNTSLTIPFEDLTTPVIGMSGWSMVGNREYRYQGFTGVFGELNIYTPEYPPFNEALATLVEKGALSIALSKDVALALHPCNGEVHILYHNLSVGAVDYENEQVLTKNGFEWIADTIREVVHYD